MSARTNSSGGAGAGVGSSANVFATEEQRAGTVVVAERRQVVAAAFVPGREAALVGDVFPSDGGRVNAVLLPEFGASVSELSQNYFTSRAVAAAEQISFLRNSYCGRGAVAGSVGECTPLRTVGGGAVGRVTVAAQRIKNCVAERGGSHVYTN